MPRYEFDARINLTITVPAPTAEEAKRKAKEIYGRLTLIDPETGEGFDWDGEDGIELLDETDD